MDKTPEITRLIHENLWVVVSFALAQPKAEQILETKFQGEWKYLRRTVFQHAEMRADRALLEMATQLRVLDDAQQLSDYFKQTKTPPMGKVVQADDSETELHFRDMTNKVMHAARFEWKLGEEPFVVCYPHDAGRWKSAEISLFRLMGYVGNLMT
jgi:hypothetical protein